MTEIVSKLDEIKEENRGELIDILDSFFDPEKEAIVPASKSNTRHRSYRKDRSPRENRRSRNGNHDKSDKKHQAEMNNNNNNNNDVLSTPDSATRSPRRHRRSRRRFSAKQLNKSLTETQTGIEGNTMQEMKPTAPEIIVA